MASQTVLELLLRAQNQATGELQKLNQQVQEVKQSTSDMSGSAVKAGAAMGAGFAVGLEAVEMLSNAVIGAVKDLAAMVSESAAWAEQVQNMSVATGQAYDEIQVLQLGLKETGLGAQAASQGISLLEKKLEDGSDAFRKMGLDAEKLKGMDPGEAFQKTLEALGEIDNQYERTARAQELFGKSGARAFLPLIESMKGVEDRAVALNTILGTEQVNALGNLDDQIDDMGAAWDGLKNQLAAAIAQNPQLIEGLTTITQLIALMSGAVGSFVDNEGVKFVTTMLSWTSGLEAVKRQLKDLDDIKFMNGHAPKATPSQMRDLLGHGGQENLFDIDSMGKPAAAAVEANKKYLDALKEDEAAAKRFADTQEREAERAAKAFDKLAEKVQDVLKFRPDVAGLAGRGVFSDLNGSASSGADLMQGINTFGDKNKFGDLLDGADLKAKDVKVEILGTKDATIDWSNALDRVSAQFQALGSMGGPLGGILDMLAQAANVTAQVGSGLKDISAGKKAGGLGGFLSQASGMLGIAGAAVGFFGGLFGKNKQKKAEEAAAKKAAHDAAMAQAQDIVNLGKQLDELRRGMVEKAASSVGGLFDAFTKGSDQSQAHLDRLSRMGAAAFAQLRADGMSVGQAFDAMGDSIDAAIAAAKKSGKKLTGPMAELADFRKKTEKNKETVGGVDALGDQMAALRATGSLTQAAFADIHDEMASLMKDMSKEGFTSNQQLAMLAPTLQQIEAAAKAGQISIDAETQALIDQAHASGAMDGLTDPMQQLVEIQQNMLSLWGAIAEVLGADIPAAAKAAIDAINKVPPPPAIPGAPTTGGTVPTSPPGDTTGKYPQKHSIGGVADYTGFHILEKGERVLTPQQTRVYDAGGNAGPGSHYMQGGQGGFGGGLHIDLGGVVIHGGGDAKKIANELANVIERRTSTKINGALLRNQRRNQKRVS